MIEPDHMGDGLLVDQSMPCIISKLIMAFKWSCGVLLC